MSDEQQPPEEWNRAGNSAEDIQGGPSPGDAGGGSIGGGAAGGATSANGGMNEATSLWLRVGGWFVMAMGTLTIVAGLVWKIRPAMDVPLLVMIAMLLGGASYVLAGQALSEGYAWALPFTVLSVICSPMIFLFPLPLAFPAIFFQVSKDYLKPGNLRQEAGSDARMAYGLWIAGLFLIMLHFVLRLGY